MIVGKTGLFAVAAGGMMVLGALAGLTMDFSGSSEERRDETIPDDGPIPGDEYLFAPTHLGNTSVLLDVENEGNEDVSISVRLDGAKPHGVNWWVAVTALDRNGTWFTQGLGRTVADGESVRLSFDNETHALGPHESDINRIDPVSFAPAPPPPEQADLSMPPGFHHLLVTMLGVEATLSVQAGAGWEPDVRTTRTVIDPEMYRQRNSDVPGDWDEVNTEVYATRAGRFISQARTVEEIRYNFSSVLLINPAVPGSYIDLRFEDAAGRWCREEGINFAGAIFGMGAQQAEPGPFIVESTAVVGEWWFQHFLIIFDLPIPRYEERDLCRFAQQSGGGDEQDWPHDGLIPSFESLLARPHG